MQKKEPGEVGQPEDDFLEEVSSDDPLNEEELKKALDENPELADEIRKTKDALMKDITDEEQKSGVWFAKLLAKVMETHAKNVSFEYFRDKYKTSVRDILAKKIIDGAAKHSMITGFVLGAGGGFGGVLTAVGTTAGELVYLTHIQLKMIYDLALVYDKPIDLEDPEESYQVLILALGIKSAELMNGLIKTGSRKIVGRVAAPLGRKVAVQTIQRRLKRVGVELTQRTIKNVISKSIPFIGAGIGAVACATFDYQSTKFVSRRTLTIYRAPKTLIELFERYNRIDIRDEAGYDALALGCYVMANTDNQVANLKLALIDYLYDRIATLKDYSGRNKIYERDFLEAFDKLKDNEVQQTIFYSLKLMACSDQAVSKNERRLLETVAGKLGEDKRTLKRELDEMIKEVFAI